MDESLYRLVSLAGFFVVACMAWATGSRQKINTKTIIGSMALAWVLGVFTFWVPWSRVALHWTNNLLLVILEASQKGALFLFGPLAIGPGKVLPDGTPSIGFILAFQVLPSVIFFSAIITCNCKSSFLTSAGNLLISISFKSIKIFYKIFCTFLQVKKFFTTINCLNQAIQPEVVGPLFI